MELPMAKSLFLQTTDVRNYGLTGQRRVPNIQFEAIRRNRTKFYEAVAEQIQRRVIEVCWASYPHPRSSHREES